MSAADRIWTCMALRLACFQDRGSTIWATAAKRRLQDLNLPILSDDLRLPTGYLSGSVKTTYSTPDRIWTCKILILSQTPIPFGYRSKSTPDGERSRISGLKGRYPLRIRRRMHISGPLWTRTRNAIKPRIYSPLRYQFRSPTPDDSCGIRTRHLLAENQKSLSR